MTFPHSFTQPVDYSSSFEAWPFLDAPDALTQLTEDEFYALAKQTPWRMLAIGARLRSTDAADILTCEATAGSRDWAAVAKMLDMTSEIDGHLEWDLTRIAVAAIVAAILDPGPTAFERVIALLRTHHERIRLDVRWAEPALRLATQIAVHQGAYDVFEWARNHKNSEAGVVWAGNVDFMGPVASSWTASLAKTRATGAMTPELEAWWRACNEVVTATGVEPFDLDLTGLAGLSTDDLFAAFRAPTVPRVSVEDVAPHGESGSYSVEDLTVSVIVPAYNPTVSFLATIQSLLDQSWPHTEILVVDDCSPEGTEYFEQASKLDPRVRVIRLAQNGGAYRARNRGLAEARGAFITFQDADDLSHSRRIERQLRPLLASPKLMGTTSRAQRVRADGALTFFGYLSHRINDSSLLFRKNEVLERLGGFDEVRKGSDSEFHERVQAAFGAESILELEDVLSLVQLTTGSLSRSDFRYGWMSGSRASYFHQFRAAHKRIAASKEQDWRLDGERPHISWSDPALRGQTNRDRFATAVLGDWKARVERASGLAGIVRSARNDSGGPVALLTGVRPRFSTVQRDGVAPELAELVDDEVAVWANWADTVHVETLVVPDPEYLMLLPDTESAGVTVERVVILLDQPVPHTPRGTSLPPLDWAERRVMQRFGVRAEWASIAVGIEALLRADGRAVVQHPLAIRTGGLVPRPRDRKRPVIGVALPVPADKSNLSPEAVIALIEQLRPENADFVVYDECGLFDALVTFSPEHWQDAATLLHGDQRSRQEFIDRLDVLLLDPFDAHLISSPSLIALATASGVPVFAPRSYAPAYGPGVHTYTQGGAKDLLSLQLINAQWISDSRAHGRSPLTGLDPRF